MNRAATSLCLSLCVALSLSCSDPDCGENEFRVADTCYVRRDAAAAVDSSVSAAQATDSAAALDASTPSPLPSPERLDAMAVADFDGAACDACVANESGTDATVPVQVCNPSAELCDGFDNDCDGEIDENVQTRCWTDGDSDGFAHTGAELRLVCGSCKPGQTDVEPASRTTTDCDDSTGTLSPLVTDICGDMIDNDCDGTPDDEANNACGGPCTAQLVGKPGGACTNGKLGACLRTGSYACRADKALHCTAADASATTEVCDGVDNDCDGDIDEGVKNACGGCEPLANAPEVKCQAGSQGCAADGVYKCQGPNAVACNAVAPSPPTWYPDCDGDGYAVLDGQLSSCVPPTPPSGCLTYLRNAPVAGTTLDCDDKSPIHFPGQLLSFSTAVKGSAGGYDFNCDGRLEVDTQEMIITSSSTGLASSMKFCSVSQTCGPTCPPGQSDLPCDSLTCARIVAAGAGDLSQVVCGMVTAVTFGRVGNGYCDVFPSTSSWVKCR